MNHPTTKLPQSGLTLVELIIASSIGVMMLVIAANLATSIFRTRAQLQILNEVQQSANLILQDMRDNIRWANSDSFSVVAHPSSLTIDRNVQIIYRQSGRNITKSTGGVAPTTVNLNSTTTQISNLQFQHINSAVSSHYLPLIRVSFNISSTVDSNIQLTPTAIFTNKRQQYGP